MKAAMKNPEKSKQSKMAAKTNPWINFLAEFREKNRANYPGALWRNMFVDAGARFRELTEIDKEKYRVPYTEKKGDNKKVSDNAPTATEATKKPRGKKQ